MNTKLREYLIKLAIENKPEYYHSVMKKFGYKHDNYSSREVFHNIIGDISEFEVIRGRPMLSSLVIYSPISSSMNNDETHGDGFYDLAEKLGKGKKNKLKKELFGIKEITECNIFWKNKDNYNLFFKFDNEKLEDSKLEFFTEKEITFFNEWVEKIYEKDNLIHKNAKDLILKTVWPKTLYWGEEVTKKLHDFENYCTKSWNQPAWVNSKNGIKRASQFKPYTWSRIFKKGNFDKDIFFTVGVNGLNRSLIYKLDFFSGQDSNLTESQKNLCKQLIPDEVCWLEIPFVKIKNYDWEKLINETSTFIQSNDSLYDEIVQSVWSEVVIVSKLKNRLIKRDTPVNGLIEIPNRNFLFQGIDIDWLEQNKIQNDIGKAGEELVIEYEKKRLKEAGLNDFIKDVKKVDDGEGYDIFSRDFNGREKKIEVKTTTGNSETPFPISLSEIEFSKRNASNYNLYRVFNLNLKNMVAEFHEFKGNLKDHFLLEGINFCAYRKNKKK